MKKITRTSKWIISVILCLSLVMPTFVYLFCSAFKSDIGTQKIVFMDDIENEALKAELEQSNEAVQEEKEYIDYGTVITLELKSNYDSIKERDILLSQYSESDLQNNDTITKILMELRSKSKQYYSSLRQYVADKYDLDIETAVASPMITLYDEKDINSLKDVTDELKSISCDEIVEKIYIRDWKICDNAVDLFRADPNNSSDVLAESELLDLISAQNAVKNFNGAGVKIGIFEVREKMKLFVGKKFPNQYIYDYLDNYGQPNTSYFPSTAKYKIRNEANSNWSYHATSTGLSAMKLAPNATYYFSSTESNAEIDFPTYIQWFLDNEVTVINYSAGATYHDVPEFYEIARTWDLLVKDNFFTAVVAAGNSYNYLASPAIASNVITVGASNLDGNARADFSSYMKPSGNKNLSKPNLIAPGRGINLKPYEDLSIRYPEQHKSQPLFPAVGTSFSAPMVAGAIGLLLQDRPILALHSEMIQALVNSSADVSKISNISNYYAGFDNEVGAGMLNVQRLLDNDLNCTAYYVRDNDNLKNYVQLRSVYIESGQTVKANLFWYANIEDNATKITDFDFLVYNESGNLVASSRARYSNNELLTFSPDESGTYTFYLQQWDNLASSKMEFLSLAWSIF